MYANRLRFARSIAAALLGLALTTGYAHAQSAADASPSNADAEHATIHPATDIFTSPAPSDDGGSALLEQIAHPNELGARTFDAQATTSSFTAEDVATAMRSRIWWQDYGSFGSQLWGDVYALGGYDTDGWYWGIRRAYKGIMGYTDQGIAWAPFASSTELGFYLDMTTRTDRLTLVSFNSATEQMTMQRADGSHVVWSSTRSPYTPAQIRNLYYR